MSHSIESQASIPPRHKEWRIDPNPPLHPQRGSEHILRDIDSRRYYCHDRLPS